MIKQINDKVYTLEKILDGITCFISIICCSLLWTTAILLFRNSIAYYALFIFNLFGTVFTIAFIECTIQVFKDKSHGFIDPNIPSILYIIGYLVLNFLNIIGFGIIFGVWNSIN